MSQEINIHIVGKDDASPVITEAMQKVTSSTNTAADATQKASFSAKEAVVGFSGLAVSAFGVVTSFDRIEKSSVAVDRANLMVQRSTQSLKSATDDYNKALASGNPAKITDATAKLSIAQEALSVSVDRASIAQNNNNDAMASFALMIAPTAITALSSISKLTTGLPGLLSSASTAIGDLNISTKGLALSAAAAVGAFALGYTVLNSLPEPMRQTAAVLAVVGGALAAASIAAVVFYTSISWGTALPFILAAVGVAVAGVTVALQNGTAATKDYATANNTASDSLQNLATAEKIVMDAETSRYQTSLDANTTYWNDYTGNTETALSRIDDKINSFYQKQTTQINTDNQQTIDTVKNGYNQQLNDVNNFYNDMASATRAGLDGIRASRSKELDTVELKYLFDKTALENAHDTGTMLEEDYQQRIGDLNTSYNHERNTISDRFRIQELEAENTQAVALVAIEDGRTQATTRIQQKQNESLLELENSKKTLILAVNTELTDALALARSMDEDADLIHEDKKTALETDGAKKRVQVAIKEAADKIITVPTQKTDLNDASASTSNAIQDTSKLTSQYTGGTTPTLPGAPGPQTSIVASVLSHILAEYSSFKDPASLATEITALTKSSNGQYNDALNVIGGLGANKKWTQQNISALQDMIQPFAGGIEGITTGPMLALLGENGPEKVSIQPLNKSNAGAVTNNFSVPVTINVEGSVDQRTLAVLKNELKNVVIEATSSSAPNGHKKIRLGSNRF